MLKHIIITCFLAVLLFILIIWDNKLSTENQNRSDDNFTLEELEYASKAIELYYKYNRKLPNSLSDLKEEHDRENHINMDNINYYVISNQEYKLCTDFSKGIDCSEYSLENLPDTTNRPLTDREAKVLGIDEEFISKIYNNYGFRLKTAYLAPGFYYRPPNEAQFTYYKKQNKNYLGIALTENTHNNNNESLVIDDIRKVLTLKNNEPFVYIKTRVYKGRDGDLGAVYEVDKNNNKFIILFNNEGKQDTVNLDFSNAAILNGTLYEEARFWDFDTH